MLAPIEIHAPRSVSDASGLLRHYGDDAAVYAGGTELLIVMKERLTPVNRLIDIKKIDGLREIAVDDDGTLTIGALATHREIARSSAGAGALAVLRRAGRDHRQYARAGGGNASAAISASPSRIPIRPPCWPRSKRRSRWNRPMAAARCRWRSSSTGCWKPTAVRTRS